MTAEDLKLQKMAYRRGLFRAVLVFVPLTILMAMLATEAARQKNIAATQTALAQENANAARLERRRADELAAEAVTLRRRLEQTQRENEAIKKRTAGANAQ